MEKPDDVLERDVRDELDWDPAIDDSKVTVGAQGGKVMLTGSVANFHERSVATDDAWRVSGVKSVENDIVVGGPPAPVADQSLSTTCRQALDHDSMVPNGAVTPKVQDGWVTLTGRVRHHFQRQEAKRVVSRVPGVLGITDEVTISGDPIPSDVAYRIDKALRRKALLDGSIITVTNTQSTVYLDGTVDSWAAFEEADDTAWNAPGVTSVVNRLVVR